MPYSLPYVNPWVTVPYPAVRQSVGYRHASPSYSLACTSVYLGLARLTGLTRTDQIDRIDQDRPAVDPAVDPPWTPSIRVKWCIPASLGHSVESGQFRTVWSIMAVFPHVNNG